MSIQGLIEDCLAAGTLFPLHPWLPSIRPVRIVYVSRPVRDYIQSGGERAGYLHGDLDSFIGGDTITVSMIPREAREAYMGILHPAMDGIWDIRSRDPRPSLRLLGGFARRDAFIGLVLYERKLLRDFFSREWEFAIRQCKREWSRRFHAYTPVTGDDLHAYLSNYSSVD